ncbi:MAG: hypothetical protein HYX92_17585 [Chloroflexi bacterium]|nr:hypothetical protein [Chloroflexota bacterium]
MVGRAHTNTDRRGDSDGNALVGGSAHAHALVVGDVHADALVANTHTNLNKLVANAYGNVNKLVANAHGNVNSMVVDTDGYAHGVPGANSNPDSDGVVMADTDADGHAHA